MGTSIIYSLSSFISVVVLFLLSSQVINAQAGIVYNNDNENRLLRVISVPVHFDDDDRSLNFTWAYYDPIADMFFDLSDLAIVAKNFCILHGIFLECDGLVGIAQQLVSSAVIGSHWSRNLSLTSDLKLYSQSGQDAWLVEYFSRRKTDTGIYVDIGAHDGVTFSNTYFLEKEMKWSGLLIEPQQKHHRNLYLNRPNSIIIPYCAYNHTGMMRFVEITESSETSDVPGGADMLSGLEDSYKDFWFHWTDELRRKYETKRVVKSVPCYNIQGILDDHGITNIDYLSVDTEGSEMAILRAIDFKRVKISVIHVECSFYENRVEAYNFLTKVGYKAVAMHSTDLAFYID